MLTVECMPCRAGQLEDSSFEAQIPSSQQARVDGSTTLRCTPPPPYNACDGRGGTRKLFAFRACSPCSPDCTRAAYVRLKTTHVVTRRICFPSANPNGLSKDTEAHVNTFQHSVIQNLPVHYLADYAGIETGSNRSSFRLIAFLFPAQAIRRLDQDPSELRKQVTAQVEIDEQTPSGLLCRSSRPPYSAHAINASGSERRSTSEWTAYCEAGGERPQGGEPCRVQPIVSARQGRGSIQIWERSGRRQVPASSILASSCIWPPSLPRTQSRAALLHRTSQLHGTKLCSDA